MVIHSVQLAHQDIKYLAFLAMKGVFGTRTTFLASGDPKTTFHDLKEASRTKFIHWSVCWWVL